MGMQKRVKVSIDRVIDSFALSDPLNRFADQGHIKQKLALLLVGQFIQLLNLRVAQKHAISRQKLVISKNDEPTSKANHELWVLTVDEVL